MVFEGNTTHSILERHPVTQQLKLKDAVSVHVYMSGPPCGDAYHYSPR